MTVALEAINKGDWDALQRNTDTTAKHLRPPMPQVRVFRTAAHAAVGNGATGTLLFDTESYDVGSLHSTSANTGRLTASISGLYLVTGNIATTVVVAGRAFLNIAKNGTSEARSTSMATGAGEANVVAQIRLARGEFVELTLTNASGASITPIASTVVTWFAMVRLGGYENEGVA